MSKRKLNEEEIHSIINYAKEMKVTYENDTRYVICSYCGEKVTRSIVPHLKKKHIKEWEKWQ